MNKGRENICIRRKMVELLKVAPPASGFCGLSDCVVIVVFYYGSTERSGRKYSSISFIFHPWSTTTHRS